MRNWLLIQLICWSVQGAIPQRDWAVREMGPGTFRNTSKMMDFFWVLWRETLRLCLETCCYDVLFLFRWFEGFNWDGLCERTLTAPVIPKVRQIQYWLLVFTAFHVSHFFKFLSFSGQTFFGKRFIWPLYRGLGGAVHRLGWFLRDFYEPETKSCQTLLQV